MKCLICKTNLANHHPLYGVLPCTKCQRKSLKPFSNVEFTTESIKEQRKEYADHIIQPYRQGKLSKEYIKKYGKKGLANVSDKEMKEATNVWNDLSYYSCED